MNICCTNLCSDWVNQLGLPNDACKAVSYCCIGLILTLPTITVGGVGLGIEQDISIIIVETGAPLPFRPLSLPLSPLSIR